MTRILVQGNEIVTLSATYGNVKNAGLIVQDDRIAEVGPLGEIEKKGPFDATLGDPGKHYVMPGFINGHHHPGRYFRNGLLDDTLETWLTLLRASVSQKLTPEEVFYHSLWSDIELIKAGITGAIEMIPYVPTTRNEGVTPIVDAHLRSGLRIAVCPYIRELDGFVYPLDQPRWIEGLAPALRSEVEALSRRGNAFGIEKFFDDWEECYRKYDGKEDRIKVFLGPSNAAFVTDKVLCEMKQLAAGKSTGIQIHTAESWYEREYSKRHFGATIVGRLNRVGFLGPEVSCAHTIWVDDDDVDILKSSGATVVSNPSNNLRLADGVPPLKKFFKKNVALGMGLDNAGINDDLDYLSDLRLFTFLERQGGIEDIFPSSRSIFQMVAEGGARAMQSGHEIGKIEPGRKADVILLDRSRLCNSPYVYPYEDVCETILHRGSGRDVDTVIVDGKVLMNDRMIQTIDEDEVRDRLRESMAARFGADDPRKEIFHQINKTIRDFYSGISPR